MRFRISQGYTSEDDKSSAPRRRWMGHIMAWSNWLLSGLAFAVATGLLLLSIALLTCGTVELALARIGGAKLTPDAYSRDAGVITAGSSRDLNFVLTNRSDLPITLLGSESSCTCAAVSDLPLTIQAGRTGRVRVRVSAGRRGGGRFRAGIRLLTDIAACDLALTITGTSSPATGVLAAPPEAKR